MDYSAAPVTGAAYIRVSTDGQMDLSPESQLDEILKYAASHHIDIPEPFIFMESEGRSGKKADNRPRFQDMIAAAKTVPRPFDCILVWKFSRFARNQDESTFYKGMLRKRLGIDVISISEPVLDGMYGRLIEMIIEWQDEFYSYNLAQDVTRGMKTKAKNGGLQSRPPLGYRISGKGDGYEIIPEEAHIVRLIYSLFVREKKSSYCLAKYLNSLGCATGQGNPFEKRSVDYILQNPIYAGIVRWNRTCRETGEVKDPSQWIVAKGSHPAIISEELFFQAAAILETRRRGKNARPPEIVRHWLGGLVKCSACGRSLSSCIRRRKTTGDSCSFQCSGYLKGKCPQNQYITEKELIPAILEALGRISEQAAEEYEKKPPPKAAPTEAGPLKDLLHRLNQKEERIKAAYKAGIDSLEEYRNNRQEIQEERQALTTAITGGNCSPAGSPHPPDPAGLPEDLPAVCAMTELLTSALFPPSQKNAALKAIVDRIVFDRQRKHLRIFFRPQDLILASPPSKSRTNTLPQDG